MRRLLRGFWRLWATLALVALPAAAEAQAPPRLRSPVNGDITILSYVSFHQAEPLTRTNREGRRGWIWSDTVDTVNAQCVAAPARSTDATVGTRLTPRRRCLRRERTRRGRGPRRCVRWGIRAHDGTDIRARTPVPVLAVADGSARSTVCRPRVMRARRGRRMIRRTRCARGAGNYVRIEHRGGRVTRYLHMSHINIGRREEVLCGEQIGLTGASGALTRSLRDIPHLHFDVFDRGTGETRWRPVDPWGGSCGGVGIRDLPGAGMGAAVRDYGTSSTPAAANLWVGDAPGSQCDGCGLHTSCGDCANTEGCTYCLESGRCVSSTSDDARMCRAPRTVASQCMCLDHGGVCQIDLECCGHSEMQSACIEGICTSIIGCSLPAQLCTNREQCCGEIGGQPDCSLSAAGGTERTCCHRSELSCSNDAECCGEMACTEGRCQCREVGQSCADSVECCGGAFCSAGVCGFT